LSAVAGATFAGKECRCRPNGTFSALAETALVGKEFRCRTNGSLLTKKGVGEESALSPDGDKLLKLVKVSWSES
jgi:hypothetical protein